MAQVHYQSPVSHITGALERRGIVNRRKTYKDERGRIVHEGNPEAYKVKHPRNYDTNPPQGAELAHLQLFGKAAHCTTALLQIARQCAADTISPTDTDAVQQVINTNPDQAEALQTYFDYKRRYQKQLGRTADPLAPTDRTGKRRRYYRLDNFIRAMIYHQLKAENQVPNATKIAKN